MLPWTEITCLKHDTCMFDKKDPMIQIFESCYIPALINKQCFKYLNLVTSLFDIQDSILEIV
jgi:hypothetical protein